MAKTLLDLHTSLSYRLLEDSAVSDTNEKARRTRYINEAYRELMKQNYWWFALTVGSDTSVEDQEIYTVSGVRDLVEVRVDGKLYVPFEQHKAFGTYNYPPLYYQYEEITGKWYLFGETELHLLPIPSSAPSSLSVSGITRSGTIATVTTSSVHGLDANNYVTIAGADQTAYNGAFRVTSVPSTTTFTITVSGSPTTPATGTITATERNIVYRYHAYPEDLVDDTDTTLIPDMYTEALVAYAYARVQIANGQRGSAADGFDEFNNTVKLLYQENLRRKVYEKGATPALLEQILQ